MTHNERPGSEEPTYPRARFPRFGERHQGPPRDTAGNALADLNLNESNALDKPGRLTDPPRWKSADHSANACRRIGLPDGTAPGFDRETVKGGGPTTTPNQEVVRAAVQEPLESLGFHAERLMSATDEQVGTVVPTYPVLPLLWRLLLAVLAVIAVMAVVEAFIGKQQWERVLGGEPWVATLIALGLVVMLGVLAALGGHSWFDRRPGVLREHGTKMFISVAVLLLMFAVAMAYSFAGGIEAPTTVSPSGGGSALTATQDAGPDVAWIRWVIYVLISVAYTWTVVLAHLTYATYSDRRRVEAYLPIRFEAERASITDKSELLRARSSALRGIVDAWHEGVARATTILTAYYGGVRTALDPALLSVWDHRSVSAPTFAAPDWMPRIIEAAETFEDLANRPASQRPHLAQGGPTQPPEGTSENGRR